MKKTQIKGLAQIPLMIALILMAIAIPVATSLIQQNQDTRNRAASNEGTCSWCGLNCIKKLPNIICSTNVTPPANKTCTTLSDGTCAIKTLGVLVPTPGTKIIPTAIPTPVKTCSWCGTSCIKKKADTVCAAVLPPKYKTCVTLNDGTCAIKGLGLIPTPATKTIPLY
jgi:hypothetical protein